jgi:crotonobetainyl-CoA:carnitine CoA-transferase CaiB-like acyl-CoA transferase
VSNEHPHAETRRTDGDAAAGWAAWAESGALWLTGRRTGPPLWPVATVPTAFDRVARRLTTAARPLRASPFVGIDVLLSGRAALMGLTRGSPASAGGTAHLLRMARGWVAIGLPRPDDLEALSAILLRTVDTDPLTALREEAMALEAEELVERAQLLGVPAARLDYPASATTDPEVVTVLSSQRRTTRPPLVVDLSALWAGPLCAKLLGDAGARVIKVESLRRPDPARKSSPEFFDWLHGGHQSVTLDFTLRPDVAALHRLIRNADVVIEASRPRALQQLGISAESEVTDRTGKVWLSITGYGRNDGAPGRVAFGDDAAVAAGLVAWDESGPAFCADAIADPMTGLHGARAVLESWLRGGGELIDLAMVNAVASTTDPMVAERPPPVMESKNASPDVSDRWWIELDGSPIEVALPKTPSVTERARPFGSDTRVVIDELAQAPS